MLLGCAASGRAAHLSEKADRAFNEYIGRARAAYCARPASLWVDADPDRLQRVRNGEVVVGPVGLSPRPIPDGLIHDWIAAEFIPGATIGEVFQVVRNYDRYSDFYAPHVMASQSLGHTGAQYRFALRLVNKALLSKSALDSEYSESYVPLDDTHWYSLAYSTSIRQFDHFGDADEHLLPGGEGSGYLWRLFTISKFMQRDGGVYLEMEVIALSRTVPAMLHWFVDPIVRRTAAAALDTSMEETRAAVVDRVKMLSNPGVVASLARARP